MRLDQVYGKFLISVENAFGYVSFGIFGIYINNKYKLNKLIHSDFIRDDVPLDFIATKEILNRFQLNSKQKEDIVNIILYLYEKIINNSMLE